MPLRTRALPDALHTRAVAELGRQQLIETVVLAGHYSLIGLTVNAFDVAPPENSPAFRIGRDFKNCETPWEDSLGVEPAQGVAARIRDC